MLSELITEQTFLEHVTCRSWEELVEIGGGLLVQNGSIEERFIQSIKDTIAEFGSYMVLVDDVAFFHGRPEAGVLKTGMSLVLVDTPVYLGKQRIKAAFTFAATDKTSHLELMSELAERLQDEPFLALLREGKDGKAILKKIQKGA